MNHKVIKERKNKKIKSMKEKLKKLYNNIFYLNLDPNIRQHLAGIVIKVFIQK